MELQSNIDICRSTSPEAHKPTVRSDPARSREKMPVRHSKRSDSIFPPLKNPEKGQSNDYPVRLSIDSMRARARRVNSKHVHGKKMSIFFGQTNGGVHFQIPLITPHCGN